MTFQRLLALRVMYPVLPRYGNDLCVSRSNSFILKKNKKQVSKEHKRCNKAKSLYSGRRSGNRSASFACTGKQRVWDAAQ